MRVAGRGLLICSTVPKLDIQLDARNNCGILGKSTNLILIRARMHNRVEDSTILFESFELPAGFVSINPETQVLRDTNPRSRS